MRQFCLLSLFLFVSVQFLYANTDLDHTEFFRKYFVDHSIEKGVSVREAAGIKNVKVTATLPPGKEVWVNIDKQIIKKDNYQWVEITFKDNNEGKNSKGYVVMNFIKEDLNCNQLIKNNIEKINEINKKFKKCANEYESYTKSTSKKMNECIEKKEKLKEEIEIYQTKISCQKEQKELEKCQKGKKYIGSLLTKCQKKNKHYTLTLIVALIVLLITNIIIPVLTFLYGKKKARLKWKNF